MNSLAEQQVSLLMLFYLCFQPTNHPDKQAAIEETDAIPIKNFKFYKRPVQGQLCPDRVFEA